LGYFFEAHWKDKVCCSITVLGVAMKVECYRNINGVRTACDPADAEYVNIRVPCPNHSLRALPVMVKGQRSDTNCWSWNGDVEKPTFRPRLIEVTDCSFATVGSLMELCIFWTIVLTKIDQNHLIWWILMPLGRSSLTGKKVATMAEIHTTSPGSR
jgi:hypothetical protein